MQISGYAPNSIGDNETAKTLSKAYAKKLTNVECQIVWQKNYIFKASCKGEGRKTWILLCFLLPGKETKQCPKTLEDSGDITHDPKFIAQQFGDHFSTTIVIVIVITFYSPSCLGQETAKGPFGLRVKLPPAHLSTTHGGGFTQSL